MIGPTSTLLLRRLGSRLVASPTGYDLDLDALAVEMGLGAHAGRHSPLRRSLERLVRFGLARWTGPQTYELRTRVQPVPARLLAHLPQNLAAAHRQLVGEHSRPRSALLSAALEYAGRGWPVLPLRPASKLPDGTLVPHGLHDATCDPARIRAWWRVSPAANVAIRTGVSVDVVDIDSPGARDALHARVPEVLRSPLVVATGHGWHLYFAQGGLPSRTAVMEGVDVRGAGGYVVAPPSAHPDGSRYRFVEPASGRTLPEIPGASPGPVPRSFKELCHTAGEPHRDPRPIPIRRGVEAYARRALEDECVQVSRTRHGSRNDRLNRAAFSIGTLAGAGAIDPGLARGKLLEAALASGLEEREATRTISSGLSAGISRPREVEEEPGPEPRPPEPSVSRGVPGGVGTERLLAWGRRSPDHSSVEEESPSPQAGVEPGEIDI